MTTITAFHKVEAWVKPLGENRTALFVSGLILLIMTAGLVAAAAVIQRRLRRYA